MNDTKTPQEQAAERYPSKSRFSPETPSPRLMSVREAYAACLEERAIPAEQRVKELEAENASLREAAQEAADALRDLIHEMPDDMILKHGDRLTRVMARLSLCDITPADR
jgi:hypothetical protein